MDPKTTRQQPEPQRVVFSSPAEGTAGRRERRWRAFAFLSVFAFVAVVSTGSIVWAWRTGDIGWASPGPRRHPRPAVIEEEKPPAPPAPVARRAIDGTPIADPLAEKGYFAVTIDNHSDALPQSGIAAASLVYEAPVEGGITRLMAVFPADADVERIGPVRSARPYFLDWAAELDALYVHVGGSPDALDRIKQTPGFMDLNEFFAGKYFWRDKVRPAPHSTYTSIDLLRQAVETRFADRERKQLAAWRFKDDAPPEERPEAAEIVVGYAEPYRVIWRYDRAVNAFARHRQGRGEKDAEGSAVLAKNVVVQYVETKVLDDVGRRRIDTKGGGEALIAVDGKIIGGRWKKDGRTRFMDAAGNEIVFGAGPTWIQIVPNDTPVTY